MDPARVNNLDELRARQNRESAAMTVSERFARVEDMRAFVRAVAPGRSSDTDESLEAMFARRRRRQ